MIKVKNIYYDDFDENGTGLYIELENGTVYRHQTSDPMIPFERVSNIILHNK